MTIWSFADGGFNWGAGPSRLHNAPQHSKPFASFDAGPNSMTPAFSRLLGGVVRRLHSRLLDRNYDARYGIETSRICQPHELALPVENSAFASEYAPTPRLVFYRTLSAVGVDPRGFTFVDLGSGKGRVLMLAAGAHFSRIEGIEFAAELHQICLDNIARSNSRGHFSEKIVVLHLDAADYLPPESPCLFYMYNPFGESVLSRVLDNIEKSYARLPMPMHFIYVNPKHHQLFDAKSFIKLKQRTLLSGLMDRLACPEPFLIYRTPH